MTTWKRAVTVTLLVASLSGWGGADSKSTGVPHGKDPVLPAGEYSARVKAMTCGGCAPLIEKTLRGVKEIGPVHVDTSSGRVHFSVKDGSSVAWSSLQAALKKSAAQMGMGADFSLSELQVGPAPQAAAAPDRKLETGYYSANVGAIVCGGCKPLIENTLRAVDGVGAAQVDATKGTVIFTILKGKTVPLSQIQAALKVAADKMAMGADYSLSDVKPVKK